MQHGRTFTISLCLNLLLAGVAVCHLTKTVRLRPPEPAGAISETTTGLAVSSRAAASHSPAPATCVTNGFEWTKLEAEDFEPLARNLRAIGCPEKTVRDVVVARARHSLEQVSRSAGPKPSFWTAGARREHAQRETEIAVAAARAKLLASADRALSPDVFSEDGHLVQDFVAQAIVRFLSGPMFEEKFSRLAVRLGRQEARSDEVRARTQGMSFDEDEAALKNLAHQFQRELAEVLSPAEREEFTARQEMIKLADEVRFEATDLNLGEIREVALIRARFDDPGIHEWFNGDSLTDQPEAQVKKALREFLGEARSTQLEHAGDGDFKTLFDLGRDLGRDLGLPRVAAVKAFELRPLAAQDAGRLREDIYLPDAERQHQLAEMQTQTQAIDCAWTMNALHSQ